MPILERTDGRINQAIQTGLSEDFQLPNTEDALATQDPRAPDLADAEMRLLAGSVAQIGGQQALTGMLSNVGYPVGSGFEGLLDLAGMDPTALNVFARATEGLREKALQITKDIVREFIEIGIGTAVDIISAIPVVGWIIDILWDFGMAIADVVKLGQASNDDPPVRRYSLAVFDPQFDRQFANTIIARTANATDWTEIMMPPGAGKKPGQTYGEPFGIVPIADDEGGGIRILVRDLDMRGDISSGAPWIGYAPGSTTVTSMYEITPHPYVPRILDTGRYLPTVRDLAAIVWGTCTKVAPPMYCLGAKRAADQWLSYLGQLRDFIQGTDQLSNAEKTQFVEDVGKALSPGETWAPFDPAVTPHEGWLIYRIDRMRPIKNLLAVHEAQLQYLTGTMPAYVDVSYGAFKNDPTMQGLLREGRRKLLETAQRCTIDVENVPDRKLREELVARGVGDFRRCPPPVSAGPQVVGKAAWGVDKSLGGFGTLGTAGKVAVVGAAALGLAAVARR